MQDYARAVEVPENYIDIVHRSCRHAAYTTDTGFFAVVYPLPFGSTKKLAGKLCSLSDTAIAVMMKNMNKEQ
jgi:hypothetical protein